MDKIFDNIPLPAIVPVREYPCGNDVHMLFVLVVELFNK